MGMPGSSDSAPTTWPPEWKPGPEWTHRARRLAASSLGPAALGVSYFLAARVGEALAFPSAPVSALWSPNAILFAALLLTKVERWWIYLLAVLPMHVLAQFDVSPPTQVAIQYVLNCAEAVIGAAALVWCESQPRRFDKLSATTNLIAIGSIFAPFVTSVIMAGAFVALNLTDNFWLMTVARTVTNTFATLTLVPLICQVAQWIQSSRKRLSWFVVSEVAALTAALVAVCVYVFVLPREQHTQFPALLYAPLPFQLWATVRFGTTGACASVLLVGALSTWGVLHGVGPFDSPFPVQNALSIVIFLDVTCIPLMILGAVLQERKRTAAALLSSEAKFRSIFAANLVPTVICSPGGAVTEANDAFLRLVGRTRYQLEQGMVRWDDLLQHEDARDMEAARQELAITGRLAAREARLVLPDGRNIPVFVGGCRLPGDPGTGVGFAFDLSELTRAKAARKRLEVLHRAVLASLEDQIAVLDDDGIVIEVNDAWRRAGERSTAPGGLLPGEDYLAAIHTAAQHGSESCAAVYAAARAVIDGDSARWRLEISVNHGSGMQWFEQTMDALQRPEGGAVVTLRDITARKRAELELQEQHQQLAHLARVAVLGEFSGAMAHEIKQPLTAILGNAEAAVRLLSVEPPDLGAIRECLLDVVADDLRAAKVIQRLRSLLCNAEIQRTPLDMNEVATEVLSLVRSDMQRRHVIARTDFALNLPRVAGDRIQIQQVLLSLMVNACEAMETVSEGERAITLATRLGSRDDEVEVLVCDAGTGIAEGLLERIFDPFVTTKPNGLGLGLAICRSIIRAHAGRLWAERASEGAVFHFTLHSWQENSEEHAQPAPVSIAGSYQEHAMQILVNADNHIVVHEALAQQVEGTVHGALDRFADQVTRVEVHLHDVNSIKAGQNDKRCMMEARLGGLKPIVVTAHAGTLGEAVDAAAGKLQRAIGSTLGRIAGR